MLLIYKFITSISEPLINLCLNRRVRAGKEDPERIEERKGIASIPRPKGRLGYIHAASVGEAQSTLILIHRLLQDDPKLHILVTTGTRTSAELMRDKLPKRAFHQFYPADHPLWVKRFIKYWSPDFVLWMESELWANMLGEIKSSNIPAALVNARMSDRSFKRWSIFKRSASEILSAFTIILTQTQRDQSRFQALGHNNIITTDNLKYSASALPCDESILKLLQSSIGGTRPTWVYASSHKGEETLACRMHATLKAKHPELLTIIIPRHPERRDEIIEDCSSENLSLQLRSKSQSTSIKDDTDIYIADTLGELGLFYRLAPIAMIGRSLSDDGGGGHNPIEAAQLNCAVIYGQNVQYQQDIFDDMIANNAAICVNDEEKLISALDDLLSDPQECVSMQEKANKFALKKEWVIDRVLNALAPIIIEA